MVSKTIDEILVIIGPCNKFQWRLMLILSFHLINTGLQVLNMTFIANDPGWKCSGNTTSCNHTGVITTTMSNYNDRCNMERKDWVFPERPTSIVTQFGLVCERSVLKNVATSMVYLGWFVGNIITGYISDKWGRKNTLLLSMMIMSTAGAISSFIKSFWLFCVLRTLIGFGLGGSFMCIYILCTEFVGPKERGFVTSFMWNFYSFGVCLASLLAYLIPDWKILNLVTSAPGILAMVLHLCIPESVRWLLVNGKTKQAETLLVKIAEKNGREYPKDVHFHENETSESRESIFEMFNDRTLVLHTFVLMAVWFTCTAVYYGALLSAGYLGGNIYLVFFLSAFVVFPSNFITSYVINRFGRKRSLISTLFGTAVSMLGAALMPISTTAYVAIKVTLAILAKMMITISYNSAYLVAFELFPTSSRNLGMGLTGSTSRFGSFSSAYVIYLGQINHILPFIFFALLAVLSSLLSLILPETKGAATRETTKQINDEDTTENVIENKDFSEI